MARIRSIKGAYNIIKINDPETAVTEYMLRKMVTEGDIPSFQTGNKYLVDADVVMRILYGNSDNSETYIYR